MSKVLWHITMSLDGFIAPRDYSAEWMFEHGSAGPMGREVMERTGAILAGRRGYDLGMRAGAGRRAIYGGAWHGPVFVLTHRPADSAGGVTFLSSGIEQAVAAAREAAGAKDVGVFGADLAGQCISAGLVDEIFVHLVPVLPSRRRHPSADGPDGRGAGGGATRPTSPAGGPGRAGAAE